MFTNEFMPGKSLPLDMPPITIGALASIGNMDITTFLAAEHSYDELAADCKKINKNFDLLKNICLVDCDFCATIEDFVKFFRIGSVSKDSVVSVNIDKFTELQKFNGDRYWKHKTLPIIYTELKSLPSKLNGSDSRMFFYAGA